MSRRTKPQPCVKTMRWNSSEHQTGQWGCVTHEIDLVRITGNPDVRANADQMICPVGQPVLAAAAVDKITNTELEELRQSLAQVGIHVTHKELRKKVGHPRKPKKQPDGQPGVLTKIWDENRLMQQGIISEEEALKLYGQIAPVDTPVQRVGDWGDPWGEPAPQLSFDRSSFKYDVDRFFAAGDDRAVLYEQQPMPSTATLTFAGSDDAAVGDVLYVKDGPLYGQMMVYDGHQWVVPSTQSEAW